MAGRGAGAQLRAPLLEGSDLSPANATFRRGGKASPSPGAGDASRGAGNTCCQELAPAGETSAIRARFGHKQGIDDYLN